MGLSNTAYGLELILDLNNCNENISDKKALRRWVKGLVKLLGMKRYGPCRTPYFGYASDKTKGYSLSQFIETSLVSAHFGEHYKTAHINIFSCKDFDEDRATEYTQEFFGGEIVGKTILERRLR